MANLRHCFSVLDLLDTSRRQVSLYLPNLQDSSGLPGLLLSRQVSQYLLPELHLFAILENSTLRRDCDLLRQFSLYLTIFFDRVL